MIEVVTKIITHLAVALGIVGGMVGGPTAPSGKERAGQHRIAGAELVPKLATALVGSNT